MKIRPFSDIHWEYDMRQNMHSLTKYGIPYFWSPKPLDTDNETTLILLGDLWNGLQSIDEIEKFHKRYEWIIVVLGNHDYWRNNITHLNDEYKKELARREMWNVIVLDNDIIEIDNKIFVGATLFTDMDKYNPMCMINAQSMMKPDFELIKMENTPNTEKPITVDEWLAQNKKSIDYIGHIAINNRDKDIIVLTHYGCSTQSIHQYYKQYGLANYFFVNDYDDFIQYNDNIKYWLHGHVHNNMKYTIGNCQVITNPRGYPNENNEFDEISLYEI